MASHASYEKHREQVIARSKAYDASHREEVRERKAVYYLNHREDILAKSKNYIVTHREEAKATDREYYELHREELLLAAKNNYALHCETIKADQHEYRLNHKEERAEKQRKWKHDNPERVHELNVSWREKNKVRSMELNHKHKAKRRDLGFIAINSAFLGCEGHHLDKDYVLHIPKTLHCSVRHNIWTGRNMEKINTLVAQSWMAQVMRTGHTLPIGG